MTIVDGDGRKESFQTSPEHAPPRFPAHEDGGFRVFRDPEGLPFCLVWD